jgi:DNA mismatch endonuclease (patch repair protein)
VDFVFRKERLAVFVDGCFWHGCPKHSSPAKWLRKSSMKGRISHHEGTKSTKAAGRTGKAFWAGKMAGNIARDRFVTRALRREGWRVVRIWEHEMGAGRSQESEDRRQKVVGRIREAVGAVRGGTD